MKKKLNIPKYYTLIFLFFLFTVFSQEAIVNERDIYKTKEVSRQFANDFKEAEDKINFKKLRDFLNEKESLKKQLTDILDKNYVNLSEYTAYVNQLEALKILVKDKKPEESVSMRSYIYSRTSLPKEEKVEEINRQISVLESVVNPNKKKISENYFLSSNIYQIDQDIQDCQNQIDYALDPENRQQSYKMIVSICFASLIGILLILFFYIVYKKSDFTLSKDLLGGYGLQFITLFVLIIAIILFGILDILKGSELAAMLSGISGYILGKGIQDKKLTTENTNPTPTVTPVIITDPIIPVNPEPAT
jgi:hypothetical protein